MIKNFSKALLKHGITESAKYYYTDDGSSIANLSGVGSSRAAKLGEGRPHASFREQFQTYTGAVKLMFLPMLAVLDFLALAYLIVYILL